MELGISKGTPEIAFALAILFDHPLAELNLAAGNTTIKQCAQTINNTHVNLGNIGSLTTKVDADEPIWTLLYQLQIDQAKQAEQHTELLQLLITALNALKM